MITDDLVDRTRHVLLNPGGDHTMGKFYTEDTVRAILEAAERAVWLPIDTAPEDPRATFLVTGHRWGDPAKGRFYERACFFDGEFRAVDPETDEPSSVRFIHLTHWRHEPTLEDFGEEASS